MPVKRTLLDDLFRVIRFSKASFNALTSSFKTVMLKGGWHNDIINPRELQRAAQPCWFESAGRLSSQKRRGRNARMISVQFQFYFFAPFSYITFRIIMSFRKPCHMALILQTHSSFYPHRIQNILKLRCNLGTEMYGSLPWQFCNFRCKITN